jgi:2-polyprenyl-3-methyl-5-hydroxy-6-metoxy-1,4-benzoquinol methylase
VPPSGGSVSDGAQGRGATAAVFEDTGRFAFGENWSKFLSHIDDERIAASELGLREMLGVDTLAGRTFVDIGSGSGLSSLAARRLGAAVHSFDNDPASVSSTSELRRRYIPNDDRWTVEQGSVLDEAYMHSLGQFDVVYSWGVLHHTGDLWRALGNAAEAVRPGGRLFVAIYNDHGLASRLWRAEKRLYVRSPAPARFLLTLLLGGILELEHAVLCVVHGQEILPFKRWRDKKTQRGMSVWHDLVDWVGGYPFEFARPGRVFNFLHVRGFELDGLTTHSGAKVNNEYVFHRPPALDERDPEMASGPRRSGSVESEVSV